MSRCWALIHTARFAAVTAVDYAVSLILWYHDTVINALDRTCQYIST